MLRGEVLDRIPRDVCVYGHKITIDVGVPNRYLCM